jgi:hypothetical protein
MKQSTFGEDTGVTKKPVPFARPQSPFPYILTEAHTPRMETAPPHHADYTLACRGPYVWYVGSMFEYFNDDVSSSKFSVFSQK